MFTGLIRDIGKVLEGKNTQSSALLKIETALIKELNLGDSIAVNGVCLTAARLGSTWFSADVMPETWKATNLSGLRPGDRVNLEPALAAGERFGGHLVSGHVDGVGRIRNISKEANAVIFQIAVPQELTKFIAHKGSVAVNGVSLTIQRITGAVMMITLIPHTVKETNLQYLKSGDAVNIEVDMMARQLWKLVGNTTEGISEEFLERHGYK
ncbi:MAG: riboflavin synthase [Bacteroidota bacterium]